MSEHSKQLLKKLRRRVLVYDEEDPITIPTHALAVAYRNGLIDKCELVNKCYVMRWVGNEDTDNIPVEEVCQWVYDYILAKLPDLGHEMSAPMPEDLKRWLPTKHEKIAHGKKQQMSRIQSAKDGSH